MPSEEQKSRSSKPLMEKRRRARINESLLQLKNLVLDALNKNNPRHSKLEKADILEMTVRYLRTVHRQQLTGLGSHVDPDKISQYRTGYAECMSEVSRYLNSSGSSNGNSNNNNSATIPCSNTYNTAVKEVRLRLLNHLATQCSGLATGIASRRSPQIQTAPVTPSVINTNNVQSMQVHIAGQSVTAPKFGQIQLSCDQQVRVQDQGDPKDFISLRSPVVERLQNTNSLATNVAVTVQPTAHVSPTVNVPIGTPGGEITLVLPQNLVQTGQLPTHLIPVYAPSPLGQAQTVTAPTPVDALTSLPPRTATASVAYSNAVISSPRDATTASPGGAAFIPRIHAAPMATQTSPYIGQGFSVAAATPVQHHQPAAASSSDQLPTSFSPMTIALPLQAKLVTTNQGTADSGNHLQLHSVIPFQGAILSPPQPPPSAPVAPIAPHPPPTAPDPAPNVNPNDRPDDHRGFGEAGNAEVKMDPMWRPW